MKATYFLGEKKFEVRELPVPEVQETDVLIRVAACTMAARGQQT